MTRNGVLRGLTRLVEKNAQNFSDASSKDLPVFSHGSELVEYVSDIVRTTASLAVSRELLRIFEDVGDPDPLRSLADAMRTVCLMRDHVRSADVAGSSDIARALDEIDMDLIEIMSPDGEPMSDEALAQEEVVL